MESEEASEIWNCLRQSNAGQWQPLFDRWSTIGPLCVGPCQHKQHRDVYSKTRLLDNDSCFGHSEDGNGYCCCRKPRLHLRRVVYAVPFSPNVCRMFRYQFINGGTLSLAESAAKCTWSPWCILLSLVVPVGQYFQNVFECKYLQNLSKIWRGLVIVRVV